jgi:hypothetical protein
MILGFLIIVTAGPALLWPWRYFIGAPWVDGYGTQWFYWYCWEVIAGRAGFWHTDLLFFPWGKNVYLHTGGNLLDAVLAQPFRQLFGSVLGYNLWVLTLILGNFFGGTKLAQALSQPSTTQWLSGLFLAFNPYVLLELQQGRPTQATLLLPALAAASAWRGSFVQAGLWVGLSGIQYWYYGLIGGLLLGAEGIRQLLLALRSSVGFSIKLLLQQSGGALVALLIALPVAWPMLQALQRGSVPGLLSMEGAGELAPLALKTVEGDEEGLYVLFPSGKTGSLVEDGGLRKIIGMPGLPPAWPLFFMLGGWVLGGRSAGPLLWVGLAWLVASGPAWVWGQEKALLIIKNPFYYQLLAFSPFLRWWWPGRALGLVWLGASVFFAQALPKKHGSLLPYALLAGMLLQSTLAGLLPLKRWDGQGGEALQALSEAPYGAVIDIPLVMQQESLYYQTLHLQPLFTGMLMKKPAFGPEEGLKLRQSNAALAQLIQIGERIYRRPVVASEEDLAELQQLGFRYLLVHKAGFLRPKPGQTELVSEWDRAKRLIVGVLEKEVVVEDEERAWWRL